MADQKPKISEADLTAAKLEGHKGTYNEADTAAARAKVEYAVKSGKAAAGLKATETAEKVWKPTADDLKADKGGK
jgi:hypothetical protein